MSNLDQSILCWRESMTQAGIGPGPIRDELESHLREKFEALVRSGHSGTEAFRMAAAALGEGRVLQKEFEAARSWRHRLIRVLGRPVRIFPTDLRFVAKCSLAMGALVLALGIRNFVLALAVAAEFQTEDWIVIGLASALEFGLAGYLLQGALANWRAPNLPGARRLADAWTFIFWGAGLGCLRPIMSYDPHDPALLKTLFALGFLVGIPASGYLARQAYRTWIGKVADAQTKTPPVILG